MKGIHVRPDRRGADGAGGGRSDDRTRDRYCRTRKAAGLLGVVAAGAGLFVWSSWGDVLIPVGFLIALAAGRWQVRWHVRPWFLPDTPPPRWFAWLLSIGLALWLIGGLRHHLGS